MIDIEIKVGFCALYFSFNATYCNNERRLI